MRYSKTHKEETRRKLVASSRALAKQGGFAASSVDELMAAIGLSGGAFYGHFPSKQALFAALIGEEIENSAALLACDPGAPPGHLAASLRKYLSAGHVAHPETGCVLPALGAEIARAAPEVREAVEEGLRRVEQSWGERLADPQAAWALIAQCIGTVVLARAVESAAARDEILASSRRLLANAPALASRPD